MIVMQNCYWDFVVDDECFLIGLLFNQVLLKLVIFYLLIIGFYDLLVNFEFCFQVQEGVEDGLFDYDEVENDGLSVVLIEDGLNVVVVDFKWKK